MRLLLSQLSTLLSSTKPLNTFPNPKCSPSYTLSLLYNLSPTYEAPSYTPKYSLSYVPSPKYVTPSYAPSSKHETLSYTSIDKYTKILSTLYGMQGVIYCKPCYDLTPIEGKFLPYIADEFSFYAFILAF